MTWNQRYYDALEFFFWEPQHLGKMKNPESNHDSPAKVRTHLRKMEVTLNHQLDIFFELAPIALHQKIFSALFGHQVDGVLKQFGPDIETNFELPSNTTQPDMFFMGDKSLVAIELKASSKSNLGQAMKYALLGLAADVKTNTERKHYLAYISPRTFKDLWTEGFESTDSLKDAMFAAVPSISRQLGWLDVAAHRPRFERLIEDMSLGFMSYGELASLLNQEASIWDSSESAPAEVYRKLLTGLASELQSEYRVS